MTDDDIKQGTAALIDACDNGKAGAPPEAARLWALAQTAYERAAMYAARASAAGA